MTQLRNLQVFSTIDALVDLQIHCILDEEQSWQREFPVDQQTTDRFGGIQSAMEFLKNKSWAPH